MKRTIILTLLILVAAAGFSQGPPGPPPFDEEKIEAEEADKSGNKRGNCAQPDGNNQGQEQINERKICQSEDITDAPERNCDQNDQPDGYGYTCR